ncbi:NB-ARC domain-containing protein [Amycolatopsis sp. cmx-4-68]|uniref:NB-ARC domain-containing protein n=1 Tax=Amycolatopsis sp. cmx-4-68 TaxID=2790938 RepID=UPI00397D3330
MILAASVAAIATTVAAIAVNLATSSPGAWSAWIQEHPLRWTVGATVGVAASGLLAWWSQRLLDRKDAELVPAAQRPEPWIVARPAEVKEVVTALLRRTRSTVGITTAVQGAGGFGKTTVAKLVRADPRIVRRFRGRVFWVTLGRDTRSKAAITAKVNDLLTRLDPHRPVTFTDPQQAGEHLATVMATGPRRLLILDDVWHPEQLAAFPVNGKNCSVLVTTRITSLVAECIPVRVDQLTQSQAHAVLIAGLPPLPNSLTHDLVKWTGRWPLLLRLVNKALVDQLSTSSNSTDTTRTLLEHLRESGAAQVDQLNGVSNDPLDINDPQQRQSAIAATIEASRGLLHTAERERFEELAIFAEDEAVPIALVYKLWHSTGSLNPTETRALCARLNDLALITIADENINMHDVIRDFLRQELDGLAPRLLPELNRALLETVAQSLPQSPSVISAGATIRLGATAWWKLDESAHYLRDHLIEHLIGAEYNADAEIVASDLRWINMRLHSGPAAPIADLALVGTPLCTQLQRILGQIAHLLAATDPEYSRADLLYSRVAHHPHWSAQTHWLSKASSNPRLTNRWPLPDLPDPLLRHTLTGTLKITYGVAISPDSKWIAVAARRTGNGLPADYIRIWDVTEGRQRATITNYSGRVIQIITSPDGSWLATRSVGRDERVVYIWNSTTGQQLAKLVGHTDRVNDMAAAPDGSWIVTSGEDKTVRTWDTTTGKQRTVLVKRTRWGMWLSPDGTWLSTGGHGETVRIWNPTTGQQSATLSMRTKGGMWISPDSNWLATTSGGIVRIWDAKTGRQRSELVESLETPITIAIAADGSWLVTIGRDGAGRIWNTATGQERIGLDGRIKWDQQLAISPDGSWLAANSEDGAVRLWDTTTGKQRAMLVGRSEAGRRFKISISPDGTWLATAGTNHLCLWEAETGRQLADLTMAISGDTSVTISPDGSWLAASTLGTVHIFDTAINRHRTTPTARSRSVNTVAISRDGRWLVTGSEDATFRIWDAVTGKLQAAHSIYSGRTGGVGKIAISPDNSWFAVSLRAGGSEIVRTWDLTTGQERVSLVGHTGYVNTVAISPNGSWMATGSDDATVRIWDSTTGQQRAIFTVGGGLIRGTSGIAISPDGSWMATVTKDTTVRIWDPATWQERVIIADHDTRVSGLATSPDGSWLAAACGDGTVRTWDTATGRLRLSLGVHASDIGGFRISPDGSWIAIVNRGTIQIWDVSSGQQRRVLADHSRGVGQLSISPDGSWIATIGTGNDTSVRIWETETGKAVAMTRLESAATTCTWAPNGRLLVVGGRAGLYGFNFIQ